MSIIFSWTIWICSLLLLKKLGHKYTDNHCRCSRNVLAEFVIICVVLTLKIIRYHHWFYLFQAMQLLLEIFHQDRLVHIKLKLISPLNSGEKLVQQIGNFNFTMDFLFTNYFNRFNQIYRWMCPIHLLLDIGQEGIAYLP